MKMKGLLHPYLIQEMNCDQCAYQLILIGSDRREHRLWEDERPELFRLQVEQRGRVVFLLNDVYPRLVLMH